MADSDLICALMWQNEGQKCQSLIVSLRAIFCKNQATCLSECFKNVSFSHILLRTMKETTLVNIFRKF